MATMNSLPRKLLTLAFLVRGHAPLAASADAAAVPARVGEVLLGEKKRGFGMGKWNGFGGKVEATDASIAAAAAREIEEEANVSVEASDLEPRGILTFTFESGKEVLVSEHEWDPRRHLHRLISVCLNCRRCTCS